MAENVISITRSQAITLINDSIENFFTFYDSYCYTKKNELSDELKELYDLINEAVMIVKNDENYHNDLKRMPLSDLTELLFMCKEMVETNDLTERFCYPKGKFVIVDNRNDDSSENINNISLIEKSLEKLELNGDSQIQKAIKEWRNGERSIMFADMSDTAIGETRQKNDFYTHYINSNYGKACAENEVRVAITLAHEFKRKSNSNTLTGETRDIILEDTKIIESFANTYGEDIFKKFPEYGILHYIKKIFGETELKEFTDYAFDSTGSYWKVNSDGDLVDDGNTSKVFDASGNELYSGTTGRQGTIEAWLSLNNAYEPLMKPAGYKYDGEKWSTNPGKIESKIIKEAHDKGLLTDDQYNLIQIAAGKTSSKEDDSEKIGLFQQVLYNYQKYNEINTQIKVDMINRAWEWIYNKIQKLNGNITGKSTPKKNEIVISSVQKSNDIQVSDEIVSKSFDKDDGIYYKQPKNFIENFDPETMSTFIKDSSGSKCNLFLGKVTNSLSEDIAKKILPNGIKRASELYNEFKSNENLKLLNPDSHNKNDRNSEQLRQSAKEAANKANDMANSGYLVIAASPDYKGYTAHVAFVIAQENTYNFDYDPDLSYQSCYQGTTGLVNHQQKSVEVLWDYPVFLQAGNSTGIVPPGSAFSRILFDDDKVDFYVIKK